MYTFIKQVTIDYSRQHINIETFCCRLRHFTQQAHQPFFPQPYTGRFSNEFISLHRLPEWVEKYRKEYATNICNFTQSNNSFAPKYLCSKAIWKFTVPNWTLTTKLKFYRILNARSLIPLTESSFYTAYVLHQNVKFRTLDLLASSSIKGDGFIIRSIRCNEISHWQEQCLSVARPSTHGRDAYFSNFYVPDSPPQVWTVWTGYSYNQSYLYVHTGAAIWNPNSNKLEPDRLQHDGPAVCVIAQQYSSATFVSLIFHFHKKKFGAH